MRILTLRFKNLNSLYGEWKINFTAPEYTSNGIFAITGPTGAGKTTILDAITLALYGETPRMKISDRSDEVFSRGALDCFSEVTFETPSGIWKSCFTHRRTTRKNASVEFGKQDMLLLSAGGKVVAEGKKNVPAEVEKRIGLNFFRFTRAVMLPQGNFAAFLRQKPSERSEILEELTGTEIYSEISIAAHEREKSAREKLSILTAELGGIVSLGREEEAELEKKLKEQDIVSAELERELTLLRNESAVFSRITELEKEKNLLAEQEKKLTAEEASFEPERLRLHIAREAEKARAEYEANLVLRKQECAERKEWNRIHTEIPILMRAAEESALVCREKTERKNTLSETHVRLCRLLKEVRVLDQKIADEDENRASKAEMCRNRESGIRERCLERDRLCADIPAVKKKLESAEKYLKLHEKDSLLESAIPALKNRLIRLENLRVNLDKKSADLSEEEKNAKLRAEAAENLRKLIAEKSVLLDTCRSEIARNAEESAHLLAGKLLREYRSELKSKRTEFILLQKIASLESERKNLEEGIPCPLCGSVHHPFAQSDAVPEKSNAEREIASLENRIEKLENLASSLENLHSRERKISDGLAESTQEKILAEKDWELAEKNIFRLKGEKEKLAGEIAEEERAFAEESGFSAPARGIALPEGLAEKHRAWKNYLERRDLLRAEEAELQKKLAGAETECRIMKERLTEEKELLRKSILSLENLREERLKLFEKQDADEAEKISEKALVFAEEQERSAITARLETVRKLELSRGMEKRLTESLDICEKTLELREKEFSEHRFRLGFDSEEQYIAALLPEERRTELSSKEERLKQRRAELDPAKIRSENALEQEKAKAPAGRTFQETASGLEQKNTDYVRILNESGAIRERLSKNAELRETRREKQKSVEIQTKFCERCAELKELIGSQDGKKFREFAQSLTFERLLAKANTELASMTDRYLLVRDETEPLGMNVVDNWQGGEIRSTGNLSGGECFLASLALALGLSNMAGEKIRVDSLFLDEGFGTLDKKALDSTLDALGSLPRSGKLIGIISHVPEIRERIPVRIEVSSLTPGHGTLSGPGVSRPSVKE